MYAPNMKLIKNYKQGTLTGSDVRTVNNAVIWLLVLIAITSIVWSISLNILTGDFNNGIIGAKIIFRERNFQKMDKRSKETFYQDLGKLINETYTEAALEAKTVKATAIDNVKNEKDVEISKNLLETTDNTTWSESTTEVPKKRKIPHLFQISSNIEDENDDEVDEVENATQIFNMNADRKFLATMTVDVDESLWRQTTVVQFVYSFPFLTEIMAIIWAAMCLVFQSGVKKYWGLPKPWRIVVPSIFVFTLMTLGTLIYIIVTNRYLKLFCTNLKLQLSDPDLISCGQAMSVLRPIIKRHQFRHDVYLNLFRISYVLSFLLWALALVVMVLRYVFAIDFQVVDVRHSYSNPPKHHRRRTSELSAIKVKSSTRQLNTPPKLRRVDERPRHKSEDDFQSAKSNFSEAVTPLMENPPPTQTKIV